MNSLRARGRANVWVIVAIAVVALFVVGLIVIVISVARMMGSPQGKEFLQGMTEMQRVERVLPELTGAFEKYRAENQKDPPDLAALQSSLPEGAYEEITALFQYSPPPPDAAPETVILRTRSWRMPGGGEMQVVVQKDLQAYTVTKAPIQSERLKVSPR